MCATLLFSLANLAYAAEGPYGGTPAPIPGTVQAENYDTGGQGVGYNVTAVNGTGTMFSTFCKPFRIIYLKRHKYT